MIKICVLYKKYMETIKDFLVKWDILGFVVAGLIGAIIMLLIEGFKSLFSMKRRKFCISRTLVSSTIYQKTDIDGLRITISYNNEDVDGPLTILRIRLRNDGEEDLMYSQRISRLYVVLEKMDVIDVSTESEINGINTTVKEIDKSRYEIKWDLMKKDEFFLIKIVAKGELNDLSGVRFDVRAVGINSIKSPEYKVSEVMIPIWVATVLIIVPIILLWPAKDMFLEIFPMKWFLVGIIIIVTLIVWIGALRRRIEWLKEQ